MNKTKKILTCAAAIALIAGTSLPSESGIIPEFVQQNSISVKAEENDVFTITNECGTWSLEADLGTPSSNGAYYNAKLSVYNFTPYSTSVKSVTFPKPLSRTVNINNKNYSLRNAKITEISDCSMRGKYESIVIPASVTTIGKKAFAECINLTTVDFEANSNLTLIKPFAFYKCYKLKNISLPNKLETIDTGAFEYCSSLVNISVPSSVKEINSSTFADTGLKNINCDASKITNFYNFLCNTNNLRLINGEYIISGDDISPKYSSAFYSTIYGPNVNDCEILDLIMSKKISSLAKSLTAGCKNDFQKAKILHDWICNKAEFDIRKETHYSDYSLFLGQNNIGMSTYAHSYKLLLDAVHIKNYLAVESNSWNIVYIKGNFYHIDTFVNDFLNTDKFFIFTDSSIPQNPLKSISVDYSRNTSYEDLHPDEIFDEGFHISCNCYLGDVNGDNKTDSEDLKILSKYTMGSTSISGIKNKEAMDINGDSRIDYQDTAEMNRYIANKSSETIHMEDFYANGR